MFCDAERRPWKLLAEDSTVTQYLKVANTLRLCGFGNCICCIENQDDENVEWLRCLDYKTKEYVDKGHSALRIAVADRLIDGTDDWFARATIVLRKEIESGSNKLISVLREYRYAAKVVWFRVAFEKYRGSNYQDVFAEHLGFELSQSNRVQIKKFAAEQPFEFDDSDSFRQHVWCLRFTNEGELVNGIDSFTARALRVMDDQEEADACSPASALYSRLDYGQDICKHIRNVLDGRWRGDFVEFVHVFKNRLSFGDVSPWLDVLYKSARRVVVGFRKKEARDTGRPDQLPEISLDYNGEIIVQPPSETSYEEGSYSNGDEFRFYRSTDITSCGCWRFVDGIFDCDHRSVLLKKLRRVEFKRNGNDDVTEIVKYLITDEESGVGVYNVCPSSTLGCGYSLGYRHPVFYKDGDAGKSQKLREGEYYKVVSTKSELVSVIAYSAECSEGSLVPLNEFSKGGESQTNVFRVPKGALTLHVGQLVFDIADSRIDKLVHKPNSRLLCVKNERGGPVGSRFFYKRNVYPVQDITHIVGLWYEFDGCRQPLEIISVPNGEWIAPRDWLWRSNGRLVMETDDRGERVFPVTFVDVDFSEIETPPFYFGEKRHVHLRTGDMLHELDIGPNDVEVDLEHCGIHFRPEINREGVQLCLRGKVIAATNGRTPEVEVSYDDINDDEAKLHIQNADAANLKFFYGDMLHPLEIPLKQDGTVPFKRLLDVSSIRDALPVNCMIAPLSGIGAYSFRIYDSKSAVLEVAHDNYEKRVVVDRFANSDDLHIRYFSSYRHHVTTNKIVLAYLLSHKQDEKPRFFPLEERMRVDDPQGLGRCVESVVAKDFFKQDIEWGTGVIGFVVEQNQFGASVQTTGFFIAAVNPAPVCLDGDILKDLRIALSERQVRRDVPMSEEDRQRLNRIENEFMSDDPQKQAAIREYICNAATVAIEMDALGSINSFCNSIRNRHGEIAWVSGFVFMAGWFVREFVSDEGFNDEWPFPIYWHPLLIAYRYQNVNPPKGEQWELQARYLIYDILEDFSQKEGCASLLLRITRLIAKIVPDGIAHQDGEIVIPGKPATALCVFRTSGLMPREYNFGYFRLFKMLAILGEALDKWRMKPTLNEYLLDDHGQYNFTLQDLREYLLFIDELDKELDEKNMFCRNFISNIASKRFFDRNKQEGMSHVSV